MTPSGYITNTKQEFDAFIARIVLQAPLLHSELMRSVKKLVYDWHGKRVICQVTPSKEGYHLYSAVLNRQEISTLLAPAMIRTIEHRANILFGED